MTDCRTTLVTTTATVTDPLRSAGERRACRLFGVPRRPRGSTWPVLISLVIFSAGVARVHT
jgi:hypothetical protein